MIPVTVLTGFLGAGKTTILNQIFQQLTDRVVLIKNEFGQVAVDSSLSLVETFEFLNGCLCCVLVGQLEESLRMAMVQSPSRIFIETSGSAFPAGIALQIKQIDGLFLDGIITVIDCLNFIGYEDTSYTAKLQAKYTDLILLNKHQLATERQIDNVIEHLNVLNTDTPKIRWNEQQMPVLCGFNRTWDLFDSEEQQLDHHAMEVDLIDVTGDAFLTSRDDLDAFLKSLDPADVYRVKGFIQVDGKLQILNWAFGRYTLSEFLESSKGETLKRLNGSCLRLTVMGFDLFTTVRKCKRFFGADAVTFHKSKRQHSH